MNDPSPERLTFPKSRHLRMQRDFGGVYHHRVAKYAGPLRVHGAPNGLGYSRLGLAISRRAGNAVRRNRIKRMIREAFRLLQSQLPQGYDLVVSARPHDPLPLREYQQLLAAAAERLDKHWSRQSMGDESQQQQQSDG